MFQCNIHDVCILKVDSGKTGDGVQCCYPKDMIYPPDGKEMQLEQVRALLPQYQPIFPEYFVEGECDMELTEAFNSMVPISDIRRDLHVYNRLESVVRYYVT